METEKIVNNIAGVIKAFWYIYGNDIQQETGIRRYCSTLKLINTLCDDNGQQSLKRESPLHREKQESMMKQIKIIHSLQCNQATW